MMMLNSSKVFKMLSNPSRLALMLHLADGQEYSINQLSLFINESVTNTARFLGMLNKHKLVERKYKDLTPHYCLAASIPYWLPPLLIQLKNDVGVHPIPNAKPLSSSHISI